jgi:hypothetical protein
MNGRFYDFQVFGDWVQRAVPNRRFFSIKRQRWSTHSFERIASGGVLAT